MPILNMIEDIKYMFDTQDYFCIIIIISLNIKSILWAAFDMVVSTVVLEQEDPVFESTICLEFTCSLCFCVSTPPKTCT